MTEATQQVDAPTDDEEIRVSVPSAEWSESESTYVDYDGIKTIMDAWVGKDVRRSYSQEGEDYDALIAMTWWDAEERRQMIDVLHYDPDAENAIGFGWSLYGLPFSVDVTASPEG
jgi:hypothetical protein